MAELEGYTADTFTHAGEQKPIYRRGEGPAVIVMAEIPGITPLVADFGRRVADLGMTAVLPSLFGTPGKEPSTGYILNSITKACISSEFATFALKKTSPVTQWLRALCRHEHERCGGPGVGAVGMCLTGGFALALMVDDSVMAPVLSQPSLPFPLSNKHKRDLGIDDDDLARVKERVAAGVCVLGVKFTNDKASPDERFERLAEELGDGFIGVNIDSSKGNPYGNPTNAHSVLTEHLEDIEGHPTKEALDQVLEHFRSRLLD
ncbi:MAG TPA: dienelactone hydrolase family protein [Acidimicrobiales bacterium]|nr:dienelactone hydrolase family protein [Acidimicrobiales bacterium]